MAHFDELMQRALTVRNNVAPSSNTAILVGGVLVSIVSALQLLLDTKQGTLTFDNEPTDGSTNPVTSNGIYEAIIAAIATIDLSACEKIINKVTSISAQSTDVQYPSAKLLYDQLQALAQIYAPLQHTHGWLEVLTPSAAATVNAQGYTITTAYYSHVLTITADATLHLPTMQSGAAIILRLTIIQDATGGRAVTFDGGAALVFNPYQTDLSLGQANYRCWVVLWFDGVNWAWLASPYVLRAESQFAYTIDGTTGGQYVTVTINGTTMQIQATSGVWQYGYNNPINSIAFTGDTGVLNVDFTNSDGLANITTLADAFKNCAALVAVDFTGCDLSNVATAADCFAGCTSLAALTIPTGTWKPDIDLSACAAFTKAAMLAVIDGLYTYASGTHTVTFNSTAWDALSQADQQAVFDAASAKGWTTNAVAATYYIRGNTTAVDTASFRIQFIRDNAQQPDGQEIITVNVDSNGDWEYEYRGKKIYSLQNFITEYDVSIEFTEDMARCVSVRGFALNRTALKSVSMTNATFRNVTDARNMFTTSGITSLSLPEATFENVTDGYRFINNNQSLLSISLPKATFNSIVNAIGLFGNNVNLTSLTIKSGLTFANANNMSQMFYGLKNIQSFDISAFTFANATIADQMFYNCRALQSIDWSENISFANLTSANEMFSDCAALTTIKLTSATFAALTSARKMFFNCTSLTTLELNNATFANLTDAKQMFNVIPALQKLSLPEATFEKVTNAATMFSQYNSAAVKTISMPKATFESITTTANANFFNGNYGNSIENWTTKAIDSQNKGIGVTFNFQAPTLNYTSFVNVANWLKDMSGQNTQTITVRAVAWNALSAAEQATIQGIVSGKNWNLATA